MIEPIPIPDATMEPAAYVRALMATLGDREPLEVLRQTATAVRSMCGELTDAQWRTPMADGERSSSDLTVRKVAGHDLAHRNQLARTVAAATMPHE